MEAKNGERSWVVTRLGPDVVNEHLQLLELTFLPNSPNGLMSYFSPSLYLRDI